MSDFVAGFAGRDDSPVDALHRAFGQVPTGFAPADLTSRPDGPVSFSPQGSPKHFSPADPSANPTEGWDPFTIEDPIAAARSAGYAEGLAAGRAETNPEDRDQDLMAGLTRALTDGSRVDRERMARELRQTVMHFVTRLVGDVGIAPELLAQRIDSATDLLADGAESALLRLNPLDVPLVEGMLPKSVFAAGDANVARGSFVLESASTIVEDGPELWLEQLAQAIDRVPVPPVC
ncbi:hypothetical protein BH09PSE4_BH09PSE4_06550 [soil metagenome]